MAPVEAVRELAGRRVRQPACVQGVATVETGVLRSGPFDFYVQDHSGGIVVQGETGPVGRGEAVIACGETGLYEGLEPHRVPLVTHKMPVRPDGPYAASKVFGEALGRYYAEEYGMSVICIRLGTVGRDNRPGQDFRSYVSWLSHRDLATLVERCIEAEGIGYDIFFAASGNTWKIYDTPRAWTVLGFQPQDNAERFRK